MLNYKIYSVVVINDIPMLRYEASIMARNLIDAEAQARASSYNGEILIVLIK